MVDDSSGIEGRRRVDPAGRGGPPPQDDRRATGDADANDEVVALRRRVADLEAGRRSATARRFRRVASGVTLVLTVLAVVLATTSVWVGATLFDTNRFMAVVQPALVSDDLDQALSDRLAAEVGDALALEERLAAALDDVQSALGDQLATALGATAQQRARLEGLPLPELQQLADPIASGLQARIDTRIDQLVTSERFEQFVVEATRTAHAEAVAIVRGDLVDRPNVVVQDDEVTIDLVPAVAAALGDLADEGLAELGIDQVPFIDPSADPEVRLERLSGALGIDLPDDFGQVTVMTTADLEELEATAALMDRLVWLALLTVLVLAVLTLVLATDRRRAIAQLGVGTALAAVVVMPITRALSDTIATAAQTEAGKRVVAVVTDTTLDSLRSTMTIVLVVALAVALVAHVVGRPAWLRRAIAGWQQAEGGSADAGWVHVLARHHDVLAGVVLALAAATLWIVGITVGSVVVTVGLALVLLGVLAAARGRTAETA